MRVIIVGPKKGPRYVQVVEDIKKPDGRWGMNVIRSFGPATKINVEFAHYYKQSLEGRGPEGPELTEIPTLTSTAINLARRRVAGLISSTNNPTPAFPRLQYGLYVIGYLTLEEQLKEYERTKDKRTLIRLIYQTQPDLTNDEEIERFYDWIKDKSPEDKFDLLAKRWHYST